MLFLHKPQENRDQIQLKKPGFLDQETWFWISCRLSKDKPAA